MHPPIFQPTLQSLTNIHRRPVPNIKKIFGIGLDLRTSNQSFFSIRSQQEVHYSTKCQTALYSHEVRCIKKNQTKYSMIQKVVTVHFSTFSTLMATKYPPS